MNKAALKKAYLTAALVSAAITMAIFFYGVVGEALLRMGFKPVLQPPASYAVKYLLYFIGLSPLLLVKLAGAKLAQKRPTPADAIKALTTGSIVTAALCELPGIAALILLLLTGSYPDFYLLLAFSAALEAYHFPRLSRWEERLRVEGHYEP